MVDSTPPTFDYLHRLPPEIRAMIFEYMVQNTIQTESREHQWKSSPTLDISEVKSHLISSPWVTLNKQYCIEYLKAFLKEVELQGQISRSSKNSRCRPYALSDRTKLRNCLRPIDRYLEAADSHVGVGKARDALFPYIKGICLGYYFRFPIFGRGFGKTERRHRSLPAQDCFIQPIKQLRNYHEQCNIPADKLSILIIYGDPSLTITAFVEAQPPYGYHPTQHRFTTLLRPVQARIQAHDYDASIAALDRELEVLKESVDRTVEMLRFEYSGPRHLSDLATLQAMIERDTTMLRRLHLEIIEEVTSFWKGLDGWYELDDMLRIAESWALHSKTGDMPQQSVTPAAPDWISLSLQRLRGYWR